MLRQGLRMPIVGCALILSVAAFASCSTAPKEEVLPPEDAARAQIAKDYLVSVRETYLKNLQTALQTSPPEASIKSCRLPYENSERLVQGYYVSAGRSAQKLRSPLNAPELWMKSWFEDFQKNRKNSGFIQLADQEWAYVEPIRAETSCLQCHSSQTSESVHRALREYYLQDDSLGFRSGDLMGLYWVRMRLKDSSSKRMPNSKSKKKF